MKNAKTKSYVHDCTSDNRYRFNFISFLFFARMRAYSYDLNISGLQVNQLKILHIMFNAKE